MEFKNITNNLDAFRALEDVDDSEVINMLKESRSFDVRSNIEMEEAEEYRKEEPKKEVTLEVIDVDADAIEHLKDNEEYIGQMIMQCNSCKATRFMNADDLVEDESHPGIYNLEAECPHCHGTGSGFHILGQVGKAEVAEPEVKAENDSLTDETKFDNDLEPEVEDVPADEEIEEVPAEEPEEGEFEEEEKDGMETEVEDDTEEVESKLGDEIDRDNVEYDDTEEKPEKKEAEEEDSDSELTAKEAEEEEEKKEKKESLTESIDVEPETVSEFLDRFVDAQNLEDIVVYDLESDNPEEIVFRGPFEKLSVGVLDSELVGFNAADGILTVNVDSGSDYIEGTDTVKSILSVFTNDFADNISLWDQQVGDEIYSGTKATAIEEFGDLIFLSFECPERLELQCRGVELTEDFREPIKESFDYSDPEDRLIADILAENGMSEYRAEKYGTDEYWIADSIRNREDLETIFKDYVFNKNDNLIRDFKEVTGYKDAVELAQEKFEAELGKEEAPVSIRDIKTVDQGIEYAKNLLNDIDAFAVIVGYQKNGSYHVIEPIVVKTKEEYRDKAENVRLRYRPSGSIITIFSDSVREELEFSSRKELTEAIRQCQNNNWPYSVKSLGKGKYQLIRESIKEEIEEPEAEEKAPELPKFEDEKDQELVDELLRVSDTLEACIKEAHPECDVDKRALLVDLVNSLGLVSEEVEPESLLEMECDEFFRALEKAYAGYAKAHEGDEAFLEAVEALKGEAFTEEAIKERVAAEEFAEAIKAGEIPGVHEHVEEEPEEAEPEEEAVKLEVKEEEPVEEIEFDEKVFEDFINNWFDENLEETTLFETLSGNFTEDGKIILEGVLYKPEDVKEDVKFTLTPSAKLEEAMTDSRVYTVTSSASPDTLEFEMRK